MELKPLSCSRCGANIPENNLDASLITCSYCGCVFVLSSGDETHNRSLIPLPENITINREKDSFTMVYKWRSAQGIVAIIAGAFMFFFGLIWILLAANAGGLFMLFGLPFMFATLFVVYLGIANVVNKTIISISNGIISIQFDPMYWPGAKKMNVSEITQLYVSRKEYSNKGNTTYFYNITVLLRGNRSTTLLKNIMQPEVAKCIEQQIEKHLGIKGISITGEYKV